LNFARRILSVSIGEQVVTLEQTVDRIGWIIDEESKRERVQLPLGPPKPKLSGSLANQAAYQRKSWASGSLIDTTMNVTSISVAVDKAAEASGLNSNLAISPAEWPHEVHPTGTFDTFEDGYLHGWVDSITPGLSCQPIDAADVVNEELAPNSKAPAWPSLQQIPPEISSADIPLTHLPIASLTTATPLSGFSQDQEGAVFTVVDQSQWAPFGLRQCGFKGCGAELPGGPSATRVHFKSHAKHELRCQWVLGADEHGRAILCDEPLHGSAAKDPSYLSDHHFYPWRCDVCGALFTAMQSLKRHTLHQHKTVLGSPLHHRRTRVHTSEEDSNLSPSGSSEKGKKRTYNCAGIPRLKLQNCFDQTE
jgi:hypothetical protein